MTVCPSCGAENREGARFCDSCGAELAPPEAAPVREERKVVSVLFCDLVGFTARSEQADPEDVRARLRPYQDLLRERIGAYGGTVEKFVGDAVMAVFGAPIAHEDDAERAIRAGLSILEALERMNAADPSLSLEVRIGVNTGEALASLDARPERGEGIVTGDVVNTAARIQAAAPVDGLAVGEETYRVAAPVFEWQELEPVEAKGKSAPLLLRRPLRPVARFGSDVIRTHSTPFVGREVEKTLLAGLLDRSIRDRAVQLVTIVGEPGVGKSRQVAELLVDVEGRPELVRWRQGRCLPYGDGIAFWALGEIVKAHSGVYEGDPPEVARDKLRAVLPEGAEGTWLEERLLPLLGIEATGAERAESFAAWRMFLESIAERDPTVLVVEDLHWADPVLLEFLEHLVERASGVPLLVVATARPELADRAPGWAGGLRNSTTITLSPLSETETTRLVGELFERMLLPAGLQQAIVERAGGNPLYAEEVVRLIRDRGLLDHRMALQALPETIQALIAARLDALLAERKALLQDAAVVGKVFWRGVVAAIGGIPSELVNAGLHELERRELIRASRTSSIEGEREFAFWHAVVRDVAYGQIPRLERAEKHVAAASWIEEQAGTRVENVADMLAYHLSEAVALYEAVGETGRAVDLRPRMRRALVLAAERALSLDPARAMDQLGRALELVDSEDERLDLTVRWASAAEQAGHTREAAAALDEVLPSLRSGAELVLASEALQLRSLLAPYVGDDRASYAEEAVSLLEASGSSRALLDALTQLTATRAVEERLEDVLSTADRVVALANELGVKPPARVLGFRGSARFRLGQDDGLREMDEAFERLVAEGASRMATVVYFNRARSLAFVEGPKVLTDFELVLDFARARGQESLARFALQAISLSLVAMGRYSDALGLADRHLPELDAAGDAFVGDTIRVWSASARAARGDPAGALDDLAAVLERASDSQRLFPLIVASTVAGMTADRSRASELLSELVASPGAARQLPTLWFLPGVARAAVAAGEERLVADFVDEIEDRTPYVQAVTAAAGAVLVLARREHERASELARSAVEPLEHFRAIPEQAHALLLLGKAQLALGEPAALDAIRDARDVFAALGMPLALEEAEAQLKGAVAAEA